MIVEPDEVISATTGARISHTGAGTLVVTIEGDTGATVTIEVPQGQVVTWIPPAGWQSATFRATGHVDVFRLIEQEAAAGG